MAEPIRNYTPQRDAREELRRKIESASVDRAEAVLAAYQVLQEAQDHGVLDTLRGATGAGGAIMGKVSEYANTPEGIRLLRNVFAAARLVGELDPAILDAAAKAMSHTRRNGDDNSLPPSPLRSLQRLMGIDGRRALAVLAEFAESFGIALGGSGSEASAKRPSQKMASGVAVPAVASAVVLMIAGFWIGRRSSSH